MEMDHHYVVGVNTELGPEEWKRDPATTGARTVGACDDDEVTRRQHMSTTVSLPTASDVQFQRSVHGTWSDAEVDFKQHAAVPRTSGYASADGTVHDVLSRESHRATDRAGLRQNQNNGLKSAVTFFYFVNCQPDSASDGAGRRRVFHCDAASVDGDCSSCMSRSYRHSERRH